MIINLVNKTQEASRVHSITLKLVPVSVISEGLGYADLKTTQIYLDSFDDDVLDQANEDIVG